MRGRGIFALGALAALYAFGGPAMAGAHHPVALASAARSTPRRQRIRNDLFGAWTPPLYRRSKNPRHRRQLRANRLHIGRRVRRRHRRAR